MNKTLKEQTALGLIWGGLNNGLQQVLGLIFGIMLGRLLDPSDFGMMAMIAIFPLIGSALQKSGFMAAIANLKKPRHEDYNSVFWFNIIMGGTIYLLLFFSAPLIADYFNDARLIPLSRYAFLSIIFASFATVQTSYLYRNLMVKEQARCNVTATLIASIVGVVMAYMGFSYWALATQSLMYILTNAILLWLTSPWRPTMKIDFGPAASMFRFSYKMLLSDILTAINENTINIITGRFFPSSDVGDFHQAHQWSDKGVGILRGMVTHVAQPVFTSVGDDDERRLRILRKLVRFTAFLSFPAMFGLALISRELIVVMITEKWLQSAEYLRYLAIGGAFLPILSIMTSFIVSRGKSGTYLGLTALFGASQIVLMLIIYPLGVPFMVKSHVVLHVSFVFFTYYIMTRHIEYTIRQLMRDTLPYCLTAAIVMIFTWLLTINFQGSWTIMLTRTAIAATLYIGFMMIIDRGMIKECADFIKQKI